jgi:hypothetical protein
MRCRLSPTADVPSHTCGAAMRHFPESCIASMHSRAGGGTVHGTNHDYSFPSDCAAPWSFLMYGFDVAYMFERRHVAGATPNAFLKAREKAASEL